MHYGRRLSILLYSLIFRKIAKIDHLLVKIMKFFFKKDFNIRPFQFCNDNLWTIQLFFGKTLIIEPKYCGLGDHLFYSILPRIVKENKLFEYVYISDFSEYRFQGIKEIVWEANPYVDGFVKVRGWSHLGKRPNNMNFLDGINQIFLKKITTLTSPEIFENIQINTKLSNSILVDFGRFSNKQNLNYDTLLKYVIKNNPNKEILIFDNAVINIEKYNNIKLIALPRKLKIYCSYVLSVHSIYCLYSGLNSLAPALGRSANIFCESYDPAQSYKANNYIQLEDNYE